MSTCALDSTVAEEPSMDPNLSSVEGEENAVAVLHHEEDSGGSGPITIVNNGPRGAGPEHVVNTWSDSCEDNDGQNETPRIEETASEDNDTHESSRSEVETKETFNVESLDYEMQVGYRILNNLMSVSNRCVNKLFLNPVDDVFPETADYYEKIKKPMWMTKMKEKFENHEYKDLTEFIADFRLMIENCYRFNGPDNFVSKKAQKLETMMKQKIALLSRDLREKLVGSSSSSTDEEVLTTAGVRRRIKNPNMAPEDPSQELLSQLRRDRLLQEREDRRQKVEDRKAMEQARIQELQDWEDNLIGPDVKKLIRTMWELPQLGMFIYLCMESLGLEEEITQYQLERGLVVPRECSDFRRLMTCLLSTPHQRKSLKSFMPYHVWNLKLSQKIEHLYKVLADTGGQQHQACYKLGLDVRAFRVMGKRNPLLRKQFHQLSFVKRVWVLKSYCDFCLETQTYLVKAIEEVESVRPMDVREVLLGSDGRGYRYINFPMFTGKDIRIYRHPKHSEPSLKSLNLEGWKVESEKPSTSSSRCSTPVNQRSFRPSDGVTSLRAKAILQAAESKEGSPMREVSRLGSEAMDINNHKPFISRCSTPETPSETSGAAGRLLSGKKRKRTSIFTGKRKRLKTSGKKEGAEFVSDSGEGQKCDARVEEEQGGNKVMDDCANCDSESVGEDSHRSEAHGDQLNTDNDSAKNGETVRESDVSRGSLTPTFCGSKESAVTSATHGPEGGGSSSSHSASCAEVIASHPKSDAKQNVCILPSSCFSSMCDSSVSGDSECTPVGGDKAMVGEEESRPVTLTGVTEEVICDRTSSSGSAALFPSAIGVSQQTPRSPKSNGIQENKEMNCEQFPFAGSLIQKTEEGLKRENHSPVPKDELNLGLTPILKKDKENNISWRNVKSVIKEEGNAPLLVANAFLNKEENNWDMTKEFKSFQEVATKCEGTKLKNDPEIKEDREEMTSDDSKQKTGAGNVVSDSVLKQETAENMNSAPSQVKSICSSSADVQALSPSGNDIKQEVDDVENNTMEVDEEETVKEVEEEEEEEESDDDEIVDLGRLELVAESMDEIKTLLHKFSNPEPIKRGKRIYPGVIKPCEEELLSNLTQFHEELVKYERSLFNARVQAQVKLRKEMENYVEPELQDKGWDSDHSQSTKESSDDEDVESTKAEVEIARQPKKSKAKVPPTTATLLTSAASKLSSITVEGDEDSNDSYQIDVSSRGRLRKRRIIPNNTEDTGLKKRKNPSSQDSSFTSTPLSTASPAVVSTTTVTVPTVIQHNAGKAWPSHVTSMLISTAPNPTIKAQLSAQTARLPGQIVRLVTSTGDVKALRVAGKSNMILSPQNLTSIRFVSNTGIVALPPSKVVASASSAQTSHPVIQQLLLNQARHPNSIPTATTTLTPSVKRLNLLPPSRPQLNSLARVIGSNVLTSAGTSSGVRLSQALTVTVPASSTNSVVAGKTPVLKLTTSSVSGAVVVTQVSTSITSQGGKQVLDLGSLSVTQIQQLVKNQAIQIHTGAGQPTTLLLTTGLQQMNSGKSSGSGSSTTSLVSTVPQIRPMGPQLSAIGQARLGLGGASSLLAMINRVQRPQMLLNNKLNPLLTISRAAPAQNVLQGHTALPLSSSPGAQVRATITNLPHRAPLTSQALTMGLQANIPNNASAPAVVTVGLALPSLTSLGANSARIVTPRIVTPDIQATRNTVASIQATAVEAVNRIPAPRIISSLPPQSLARSTLHNGENSLQADSQEGHVSHATTILSAGPTADPDNGQKPQIITVPLAHLSPNKKKYACNVTVKALLENRSTSKKTPEECSESQVLNGQSAVPSPEDSSCDALPDSPSESSVEDQTNMLWDGKSTPSRSPTLEAGPALLRLPQSPDDREQREGSPSCAESHILPSSCISSVGVTFSTACPRSFSLDTAIQPLLTASAQVTLPTVNMKVPSPSTLPSLMHNKNGTTIVQSTKVPIPATSTRDGRLDTQACPTSTASIVVASVGSSPAVLGLGSSIVNSNVVIAPATVGSELKLMTLNSAADANHHQTQIATLSVPRNSAIKVVPQGVGVGNAGQFVQGFMTSKGFVIPQTALVQQQQQQQQPQDQNNGNVIITQTAQLQVQPVPLLGNGGQQAVINIATNTGQPAIALGQQQQQQNIILSAASNTVPNVSGLTGLSNASNGQGSLKVMFLNPSVVPTVRQGIPSSNPNSASNICNPKTLTSTPAAELFKQIASNTQGQQGNIRQLNKTFTPGISQSSNNVLPVQGVGLTSGNNKNFSVQSSPGQESQSSVGSQTIVSPQLAAQILALQQRNQNLQIQQLQSQTPGGSLVLTAKPGPGPAQPKSSVVTLQLQQLGQVLNNMGGVARIQVGGATTDMPQQQQQQQPAMHIGALQKHQPPGGVKLVQQGQIVQLAVNPQSAQGSSCLMPSQQTPRLVHLPAQANPQIQLSGQGVTNIRPQGGLVLQQQQQQPSLIQTQTLPRPQTQPILQNRANIAMQPTTKQPAQGGNIFLPRNGSQFQNQQIGATVMSSSEQTAPQLKSTVTKSSQLSQIQFVLNAAGRVLPNPSAAGVPSSVVSPCKVVTEGLGTSLSCSLPQNVNAGHVIRAATNPQQSPPFSQPMSNNTFLLGNPSLNAAAVGFNKATPQVIIPNSGSGQLLISPLKLTPQVAQTNLINPIKLINPLPAQLSTCSVPTQPPPPLVLNTQLAQISTPAFSGLQNQLAVKPTVIYAGQPNLATEGKTDGKVAQILLSQSINSGGIGSSQMVVSNHQPSSFLSSSSTSVPASLSANTALTSVPADATLPASKKQTLLYKIGDQYFSPTSVVSIANVQPSLMSPSYSTGLVSGSTVAAGRRSDIQLLVPPVSIEASDLFSKQNAAALTAVSSQQQTQVVNSTHVVSAEGVQVGGHLQGTRAVNGIHQGNTQFSFSLTGPAHMSGSNVKMQRMNSSGDGVNGETGMSTSTGGMGVRRNTFSGGQNVAASHKGAAPLQRHMSVDHASLTSEQLDEEEAALNLLTFANQTV